MAKSPPQQFHSVERRVKVERTLFIFVFEVEYLNGRYIKKEVSKEKIKRNK